MKKITLVVTISDASAAASHGGEVECESHIVEIESEELIGLLTPVRGEKYVCRSLSYVKPPTKEPA